MLKLQVDLLKGNIFKSLILFAIPLFISNIFQQLYNTMDTMIVGHFLGDVSLAAIGACTPVYDLLIGFALGIGNGLSIVTARSYGAGDEELVKRSVAGSVIIGLCVTGGLVLITRLCLYPLLQLLDTPQTVIEASYSYISTITLFAAVMFSYNLCAGLLRAAGNSIMPLFFLIISSMLNIVLDLLFITRFQMGIRGAAIATVIAQGFSAVLCILYIWKKVPVLIPQRRHFAFDKSLYKELLGQGLSMGLMMCIVSTGSVILQRSINGLGYLTIAGHTAARKLNSFSIMPVSTAALSLSTFVSQNKGANQGFRIRRGIRYGNLAALIWSIIASILLFFLAPDLVKMLSGSKEAVVISNGSRYLRINAPFYWVLGVLLNLRFGLQGLGEKVVPLFSSIIEFLGKILFSLLLIPVLGYTGVILCEPVIWCIMALQLTYAFYTNPYIRACRNRP